MSKMGEVVLEMEELVEQGMSAKFIAAKLNVPIDWAMRAIEVRHELEEQKRQEFIGYGEEL
jgi:hypothetical protein